MTMKDSCQHDTPQSSVSMLLAAPADHADSTTSTLRRESQLAPISAGQSDSPLRLHFLDNLRTFVVFLVVLCHAGIVYESSGYAAGFWIVDDPATNDLSGLVNLVVDLFMMPTLFFISGYLALPSLRKRRGWAFVKAKSFRLILPWAIAVLTLIPLYKVIFLYSRGLPQEHWTTYFHFSNGFISQNWLWFLPVLFMFNMVFLLLSKLNIQVPNVTLKGAIAGSMFLGLVYCMAIDLLGLIGWTKIVGILDFQTERLLVYFMVFLIGALCYRLRVFDKRPTGKALYISANTVAWIPINVYIVFLLYPWFNPGKVLVSATFDKLIFWSSYQISMVCLVYLAIETFRRYQNKVGWLRRELNRNSYYVYIIHVIVLGSLAVMMLDTAIPSLVKYILLTLGTFVASHAIITACRKMIRAMCGVEDAVAVAPRR